MCYHVTLKNYTKYSTKNKEIVLIFDKHTHLIWLVFKIVNMQILNNNGDIYIYNKKQNYYYYYYKI